MSSQKFSRSGSACRTASIPLTGWESLEHRELLAALRMAAWNAFNSPNTLADDANFRTVIEAMGQESVFGSQKRLDLLALTETDPPSASRLEQVFDGLYGTSSYTSVISSLDGGGDATGFIYDAGALSLLETQELTVGLTHHVLRGKFRPQGTLGESDFYVYPVHLKSGGDAQSKLLRGQEMSLVRSHADALGATAQVLYMGDFNMNGSAESAWTAVTTPGLGRAVDAANQPGEWENNASFSAWHTHSTSSLGQRFDLQFISDELSDGVGVDFVSGSYRVFGNNGSHPLDGPIDAGNGAAAPVLAALRAASDHLPVVADYQIVSVPPVLLTQTNGSTSIIENGAGDTYSLVLGSVPTSDVTVSVAPPWYLNVGAGPGNPRTFTFTTANALLPQIVSVTAANDSIVSGNRSTNLQHAVASLDANFNDAAVSPLVVQTVDDDRANLLINEVDSDTPGLDSLEFVELYDSGIGNYSLDGYSVVFFNGNGAAPYAAFDLDGYTSDSRGFFVLGNPSVANVDLVFATGTLQNGADAVALYRGNPADFTSITVDERLVDALVYDTSDPDDPVLMQLLLPGQPQVNEDAGGNGDIQSMARTPNGGLSRNSTTYSVRVPTPGVANVPIVVDVDFDDDSDADIVDLDQLTERIAASLHHVAFDLTGDGLVDSLDLTQWLTQAGAMNLPSQGAYRRGDANLDGVVDGSDFGFWNANKFTARAKWSQGDFTSDAIVDGSDFGLWNANKFQASDEYRIQSAAPVFSPTRKLRWRFAKV